MNRLICRLFGHRWEVEWRYGRDGLTVVGLEQARCVRCGRRFV